MTDTLVFIEACTVCSRVQRTYLGRLSARKTPLVCAQCSEEAQTSQASPKQRKSVPRSRG